jgi:hypothetical protein
MVKAVCSAEMSVLTKATRRNIPKERTPINSDLKKIGVFWVVTPCGSCKNRRFGGTWRLLHQGDKNR